MSVNFERVTTEARRQEQERPGGSPVMYQRWRELLFLHWSVDPKVVSRWLPPGLRVDTFDGRAWIGIVPFSMQGVRPRGLPAVKGLSNFPELNLRTYVHDAHGRPGVWFFSLDTPKRLPNWIARTFFHLNYRLARMEFTDRGGSLHCRSELRRDGAWDRPQDFCWSRGGSHLPAQPDSLEFFLAERYRLFAYNPRANKLLTGRVHHSPYPLQEAKVAQFSTRLFKLAGFHEPAVAPDSVLASAGVDVEIFPMGAVTS